MSRERGHRGRKLFTQRRVSIRERVESLYMDRDASLMDLRILLASTRRPTWGGNTLYQRYNCSTLTHSHRCSKHIQIKSLLTPMKPVRLIEEAFIRTHFQSTSVDVWQSEKRHIFTRAASAAVCRREPSRSLTSQRRVGGRRSDATILFRIC